MMRPTDDTLAGRAIVAIQRCTCGAYVVVPITGAVCVCGRQHLVSPGEAEAEEAVALSEMPGRRRGAA